MPILRCYVDDRTMHVLERIAAVSGRTPEELAEAAIENEAIAALPGGYAGSQQHFALTDTKGDRPMGDR